MPLDRLRSGDLRQRVSFLRNTDGEWQAVFAAAAEVLGQDGREAVIGQALQGISTYRIRIRFRTGLTTADQVKLADGTDLNILSITDPNGDREQTMILASTGSALPTS